MADQKITDFSALTGAGTAVGDLIELVDVSDTTMHATGTNKKQTVAELGLALVTSGGLAPTASPTFTTALTAAAPTFTGTTTAAVTVITGTLKHGTSDGFAIKGRYLTGVIAVAVPDLTNLADGAVDVDISSDPLTFAAAVGDEVTAIPQEAMPTHALIANAYVIGADSVRVVFVSDGTSVTGASKNFKFLITDLT